MEKFFLAFDDPFIDQNYDLAHSKIKDLRKVITHRTISGSHKYCAELSLTDQFMVLDADAVLLDNFNLFDVYQRVEDPNYIYIFRARNPVNDLEYGHGGIKIFQRKFFSDVEAVDFSTSFKGKIKTVDMVLNVHAFNTTPLHSFRTAFRECVKLASGTIPNRNVAQDEYRLSVWCEKFNDVPWVEFAKEGALLGREYGHKNKNDESQLRVINDFKWLMKQYEQVAKRSPRL
jgi:hypothetical protein